MKSLILVVLLAAAATAAFVSNDYVDAPEMIVSHEDIDASEVGELAVPTAVASRSNLSVGTMMRTSRLLARTIHIRGAANNVIHVQDVTFRTNLRITRILVVHVGTPQGATASIRAGGVGTSSVTIRLQSARSRGYHYQIEIYGR